MSFSNFLRRLDVYKSIPSDFTNQTMHGALASVLCVLFMTFLFFNEFASYYHKEVVNEMFVDPNHAGDDSFDVLFSVTTPHLPCAAISVDIVDNMGRHDIGVEKMLRKRRYDGQGNQLDYYDSSEDATVKEHYEEQRRNQESCNIHGHINLNRVPGNFHFSTHLASQFVNIDPDTVDFQHIVEHMNFGYHLDDDFDKIKGAFTPLNGFEAIESSGHSYEYYFQVVPTIYERLDGSRTTSYQFTYAYKPHKDEHAGHAHPKAPPAIFFKYELSPITVKYTERRKSFLSFLTSVCAIIGGVFTVVGIINGVFGKSLSAFSAKVDLGKAG